MYASLKLIHVAAAILTVSGFALRAYWMLANPDRLGRKAVRILPHVVDTVFLAAGVALVFTLRLNVLAQPWLLAKLVALLAYIALGTIALRRGRTRRSRSIAALLALATFGYIYGVAVNKTSLSWFAGLIAPGG